MAADKPDRLALRHRRLQSLLSPTVTAADHEDWRRIWRVHGAAVMCDPAAGSFMCPVGTEAGREVLGTFVEWLTCGYCGERVTMTYYRSPQVPRWPLWGTPRTGDNCWLVPPGTSKRFPVTCRRDGRVGGRVVRRLPEDGEWTPGHYPGADVVYYDGDLYFVYVVVCPRGLPVNIIAYRGPRSVPYVPDRHLAVKTPSFSPFRLSFCLNRGSVGDDLQRGVYCGCCGPFTVMLITIRAPRDDPEGYWAHRLLPGHSDRIEAEEAAANFVSSDSTDSF